MVSGTHKKAVQRYPYTGDFVSSVVPAPKTLFANANTAGTGQGDVGLWSGSPLCVPEDRTYKAVDGRIPFNPMPMNVPALI